MRSHLMNAFRLNRSAWRRVIALVSTLAVAGAVWTVRGVAQQASGTITYTLAQATAGKAAYDQNCSACHGPDLSGGNAPALKGFGFIQDWGPRTVADLFQFLKAQMPPGG